MPVTGAVGTNGDGLLQGLIRLKTPVQHAQTYPHVLFALALPIHACIAVLLVPVALRPVLAVLSLVPVAHSPELDALGLRYFQGLGLCRSSCTHVYRSQTMQLLPERG